MAAKEIKGIFSPRNERFPGLPGSSAGFFKDAFSLRTILLLGATAQAGLTLVLPPRYALFPTAFLLLHTIASTVHSVASPSLRDIIPGRTSIFLPPPTSSPSPYPPSESEKQGLVTLHLGVRFSHPLGLFAPGVREIGDLFSACNNAVLESAGPYGCIGYTLWRGITDDTNNTVLGVYYFKTVEGLHRFAHDDVHRKAWEWYERECAGVVGKDGKGGKRYIGVYHETLEVEKGGWEAIYVNMPPTLLGATKGKEEEVWVSPLVEAKGKMFKGQYDRMGRAGGKE
ncbi:hypothetical protein QBC34DRAFT_486399 [Podospora aff. communis PSN243]|uniref:Monooxygenase n=1 Tax=Podospora aff. communis PSN243 TaxID=3040156 RepID=A0AAV9GGB5_9PEZI|nr:hypothetical protein QBC34DRAFT_486399 [Podospora aff. communis PSN243]